MKKQPPIHHFEYDNFDGYFFPSCSKDIKLHALDIEIITDDSMEKCSQCLAIEVMRELAE